MFLPCVWLFLPCAWLFLPCACHAQGRNIYDKYYCECGITLNQHTFFSIIFWITTICNNSSASLFVCTMWHVNAMCCMKPATCYCYSAGPLPVLQSYLHVGVLHVKHITPTILIVKHCSECITQCFQCQDIPFHTQYLNPCNFLRMTSVKQIVYTVLYTSKDQFVQIFDMTQVFVPLL